MPITTSVDGVSEVLFRAGRWWTEAFSTSLLDADIASIEGWRVLECCAAATGSP